MRKFEFCYVHSVQYVSYYVVDSLAALKNTVVRICKCNTVVVLSVERFAFCMFYAQNH